MKTVLSSFDSYFRPEGGAPYATHSTGQIARRFHDVLAELGTVAYFGGAPPAGVSADLYVGHFWAFADFHRRNVFRRSIAFYSIADPGWMIALLSRLADELHVPMPWDDLPPASFDHEETLELADLVLLVGNSHTLATFPEQHRHKVRLLNYSVAADLVAGDDPAGPPPRRFCYPATTCGLRKGFMDVLETWSGIDPRVAEIHAAGRLEPPWDRLLREHGSGSIVHHGWVGSETRAYGRLLRSCRFAHVPTYAEGQMGTLLDAIFSGCVPITTAISGVDDRVLEHCVVVEPRRIGEQRDAVLEALAWPDAEFLERRLLLREAARRAHTWAGFRAGFARAIDEVLR